MDALTKLAAKQHLTQELTKSAQMAGIMNALRSAKAAVAGMKMPAQLGARLGGKTVGQLGSAAKNLAMANPGKAALGIGGAGFLAGRLSKGS